MTPRTPKQITDEFAELSQTLSAILDATNTAHREVRMDRGLERGFSAFLLDELVELGQRIEDRLSALTPALLAREAQELARIEREDDEDDRRFSALARVSTPSLHLLNEKA